MANAPPTTAAVGDKHIGRLFDHFALAAGEHNEHHVMVAPRHLGDVFPS